MFLGTAISYVTFTVISIRGWEGALEGLDVGAVGTGVNVGAEVGLSDGSWVGPIVGVSDGSDVGSGVTGAAVVGPRLGLEVGAALSRLLIAPLVYEHTKNR